jgi:hypothetical protein
VEDIPELTPGEKAVLRRVGGSIAQTNVVICCLVRALIHQPGFDSALFIKALKDEEQRLHERLEGAKGAIRQIVAEVEGYT